MIDISDVSRVVVCGIRETWWGGGRPAERST